MTNKNEQNRTKVTGIVHPKIVCIMWNLISIHALSKTVCPMLEHIPVPWAENVICGGFSFNIVKGIIHFFFYVEKSLTLRLSKMKMRLFLHKNRFKSSNS